LQHNNFNSQLQILEENPSKLNQAFCERTNLYNCKDGTKKKLSQKSYALPQTFLPKAISFSRRAIGEPVDQSRKGRGNSAKTEPVRPEASIF
jgi:hypothetical protein